MSNNKTAKEENKRTFADPMCSLPQLLNFFKRLKEIIVVKIFRLVLRFDVIRVHIIEDFQNALVYLQIFEILRKLPNIDFGFK